MPVFQLFDKVIFPPAECADVSGLLAVGGDLSEERLLAAYASGIFPWYSEDQPLLWWSPDPRLILIPEEMRISRRLERTMRKSIFAVTMDAAFEGVIRSCATVHVETKGTTWITEEMIEAYLSLHDSGFAHSVESWQHGELVGGIYGVSLGGAFFGESMFTRRSNASKVALVALAHQLKIWKFKMIDCQVTTQHLMSLGAKEVSRTEFMILLRMALEMPTHRGRWSSHAMSLSKR